MTLRARFWLWLWLRVRERAIAAVERDNPVQISDAQGAWERDATLAGDLTKARWQGIRALPIDLALHTERKRLGMSGPWPRKRALTRERMW